MNIWNSSKKTVLFCKELTWPTKTARFPVILEKLEGDPFAAYRVAHAGSGHYFKDIPSVMDYIEERFGRCYREEAEQRINFILKGDKDHE